MNERAAIAALGVASGAAVALILTRKKDKTVQLCDAPATEVADKDVDAECLEELSESVLGQLVSGKPVAVADVDPSLHYLAPYVPKPTWSALGDLVAAREKKASGLVDGSRWLSLRLDGCGFSKAVKMMRRKGVLPEEGFSETFAACMRSCLKCAMKEFNGRLGYTQSDEMVIFIPPANVVRGVRQCHLRNGRVTKITTLAASLVTAHFVMELSKLCQANGVSLESLAEILPHFDCRLGHYASWEEARALLMWRAYDCSVNGVSDAVYQIKGSGKQIQTKGVREKLSWLCKQGHLPLPSHQAYGTVVVRVKRRLAGHNPHLGTSVETLRSVLEEVQGPVLELARTDALLPKDDVVEQNDE